MYYTLSEKEAIIRLSSKESGLSEKEAQKRLEKYGLNELKRTKYQSFKLFSLPRNAHPSSDCGCQHPDSN